MKNTLVEQLRKGLRRNRANFIESTRRVRERDYIAEIMDRAMCLREEAKTFREEADAADIAAKELERDAKRAKDILEALPPLPEPFEPEPILTALEKREGHEKPSLSGWVL